jgi:hypothetical protein
MQSLFVYTLLAILVTVNIYNWVTFHYTCAENFGISSSDQQKIDDYKKNQGNIVSIINIYNNTHSISRNYSNNTNIMKTLDTFKSTITPIWKKITTIRNAWVNYQKDTGGTAESVQIGNEFNTNYDILLSLKNTFSKSSAMIKIMIDNGLPDSYRTSSI